MHRHLPWQFRKKAVAPTPKLTGARAIQDPRRCSHGKLERSLGRSPLRPPRAPAIAELPVSRGSSGTPEAGGSGRLVLNDYEMASRLSYFLLGTTPDAELLTAAAAGTLWPTAQPKSTRLLALPSATASVQNLFGEYLGLARLDATTKLATLFSRVHRFAQSRDAIGDHPHADDPRFSAERGLSQHVHHAHLVCEQRACHSLWGLGSTGVAPSAQSCSPFEPARGSSRAGQSSWR